MPDKSRVIEAIFDHRWAILPGYLQTIIEVANRQGSIEAAMSGKVGYENRYQGVGPGSFPAPQQIAVIDVIGPIFPRANLMTDYSGATAISAMQKEFKTAMEDPNIAGIILAIDSPGGEVTGVSEFANAVFNARGIKPVTAYVQGMAASAAYWIASAADEIVLADTAEVGSIGVVAAYSDDREAQKKRGVTRHEIVSSQSPNKRPDVSTAEGRAQVQSVVDALAEVFVSTVARNREVTSGTVLEQFGQGGMFVGQEAVKRKMADRVGTFETMLKGMEEKINGAVGPIHGGYNMNENKDSVSISVENVEAVAKVEGQEAEKEAGVTSSISPSASELVSIELERVRACESLSVPGYEGFIAAKKWDPGMTKEKLSAMILDDMESKRKAHGQAIREDAMDLASASAKIGNMADIPASSESAALASAMLEGANAKR